MKSFGWQNAWPSIKQKINSRFNTKVIVNNILELWTKFELIIELSNVFKSMQLIVTKSRFYCFFDLETETKTTVCYDMMDMIKTKPQAKVESWGGK